MKPLIGVRSWGSMETPLFSSFTIETPKWQDEMVIKVDRKEVFKIMKLQKIKLEKTLEIFPYKTFIS